MTETNSNRVHGPSTDAERALLRILRVEAPWIQNIPGLSWKRKGEKEIVEYLCNAWRVQSKSAEVSPCCLSFIGRCLPIKYDLAGSVWSFLENRFRGGSGQTILCPSPSPMLPRHPKPAAVSATWQEADLVNDSQ